MTPTKEHYIYIYIYIYIYTHPYIAAASFGVTCAVLCGLYNKRLLFIPCIYNDQFTVINQHMHTICIYAVIIRERMMQNVREWCRKFRDGRTDVHDEGGQGRHSIVTDELVQKVDQCVRGKRRFTISELSEEFPQSSRTTLYRIVTDRLGYHKFCARWVPKQLTDIHKTQRMGSALTFLQRYW